MRRPSSIDPLPLKVVGIAILSIILGLLIANLTGQYVAVFAAQVVVAGLLGAWYVRSKKDSTRKK